MIECTAEQSDERKILTIEGELTIVHAAELKKILQEAIDTSPCVELNIDRVTDVDLSCLQLFCSAHRTSLNRNGTISIRSKRPAIFREAVRDAGFPLNYGCELDPDGSCLWIEKT